uniref:Uncharacterized protein n=1 Tax=Setaria italica TaxID=4555 RepID=K3Z273_SETIT
MGRYVHTRQCLEKYNVKKKSMNKVRGVEQENVSKKLKKGQYLRPTSISAWKQPTPEQWPAT